MATWDVTFIVTSPSQFGAVNHLSRINSHVAHQRHKHRASQSLVLKGGVPSEGDASTESVRKQATSMELAPMARAVRKRNHRDPVRGSGPVAGHKSDRGVSLVSKASTERAPSLKREQDTTDISLSSQVLEQAFKRSLRTAGNEFDPFNCTPIPVQNETRNLLQYFASLWTSCSTAVDLSIGWDIVRECFLDELQMSCMLAAMSSRLENFHYHLGTKQSAEYTANAIQVLRQRLDSVRKPQNLDVYAVMKLYNTEAYRSNLSGALIHLRGAVSIYEQIKDWKSFTIGGALTLCGTGEAFLLPATWHTPAVFPTIADPGRASRCFSGRSIWHANRLEDSDQTATIIFASFETRGVSPEDVLRRHNLVRDMVEWTVFRRKLLARSAVKEAVPEDVVKWAHLRRVNLILRLFSIPTSGDAISHSVKVCLVIWLALAADLAGFGRNLEILAEHLRDIIQQMKIQDITTCPRLVAWMLFLGAVVSVPGSTAPWFTQRLREIILKSGQLRTPDLQSWASYLRTINESSFYCEQLQENSVCEVARKLNCLQTIARGQGE